MHYPGKPFNVDVKQKKSRQNEHLPKYFILEGFRQNGYQIRIQRKTLRISALVNIYFGYLFETCRTYQKPKLRTLKTNKNEACQAWGVWKNDFS